MKCKNCLGSGYLWATISPKYGSGPVYAPVPLRCLCCKGTGNKG